MTDQERCDDYFVHTDRDFRDYDTVKREILNMMSENSLMNFFRLLWAMDVVNRRALIRSLYMVLLEKEQSYLSMWNTETEEMHAIMREMVELVDGWLCTCDKEEEFGNITWTFIPL